MYKVDVALLKERAMRKLRSVGAPSGDDRGVAESVLSDEPTEVGSARLRAVSRLFGKCSGWAMSAAVTLAALGIVGLVGIVMYEILAREFFHTPASWTTEISTSLFIWVAFLGASYAVGQGTQPRIDAVARRISGRASDAVTGAVDGLSITTYLFFVIYGIQLFELLLPQQEPATGLSLAWTALVIPVASAVMLLHKVRQAIQSFNRISIAALVAVAALGLVIIFVPLGTPAGAFYPVLIVGGLAFLLLGLPVAESLFLAGILAFNLSTPGASNVGLAQYIYSGIDDFTYVAIPLFLLTGALVAYTLCASNLAGLSRAYVGWLPGGLAVTDVASSALFADISGSVTADTAALTGVMVPELVKDNYPLDFSSGLQAAAGTLGLMFPPTISVIIYASVANVSVGYMFAALIIPGLLVLVTFSTISVLISRNKGYGTRQSFVLRTAGLATWKATPALGLIVVVIGGIFSGLFTATEAGAVAAVYVAVLSALGYKRKGERVVLRATSDSAAIVGRTGFIIAAALFVGTQVVAFNGPQTLINTVGHVAGGKYVALAIVIVVLIFLNSILETIATILITVPVLLPLLMTFNVSLTHFGVIMQLTSAIGLLLPPLGLSLFLVSSITHVSIFRIARRASIFTLGLVVDLALVFALPQLTSFLPNLLGFH